MAAKAAYRKRKRKWRSQYMNQLSIKRNGVSQASASGVAKSNGVSSNGVSIIESERNNGSNSAQISANIEAKALAASWKRSEMAKIS